MNMQNTSCSLQAMALEGMISSPHRRTQTQTVFSEPISKKQYGRGDELGSCATLVERHRFLLTAFVLLAVLCTIYLYFAVSLGDNSSCSGLKGAQKTSCHLQRFKATLAKGKLKLF